MICTKNVKQHIFYVKVTIYPTPRPRAECDTRSILKQQVQIQSFSFSLTGYLNKAKVNSVSYHLPVTIGRRWFMPSPKTPARSKTQTASSMIWTQVANSISDKNNHYTKCAIKFVGRTSLSWIIFFTKALSPRAWVLLWILVSSNSNSESNWPSWSILS